MQELQIPCDLAGATQALSRLVATMPYPPSEVVLWNTAQVRVSTLLGRFESGGLLAAFALNALFDELQALICSCVILASTAGMATSFVGWAGPPRHVADGSHVPPVDSPSLSPSGTVPSPPSTVSPLSPDSPQGRLERLLGATAPTSTPPAKTVAEYEVQALRAYATRATLVPR